MTIKVKPYKWIAIGLALWGVLWVALGAFLYWKTLSSGGLSQESADWGTFGDFVSGFPGTLIALATLFALALTLHLQAEELARTSAALEDQARATNEQLRLTRQTELLRIRPLMKAE